jgi:hypothetical protein
MSFKISVGVSSDARRAISILASSLDFRRSSKLFAKLWRWGGRVGLIAFQTLEKASRFGSLYTRNREAKRSQGMKNPRRISATSFSIAVVLGCPPRTASSSVCLDNGQSWCVSDPSLAAEPGHRYGGDWDGRQCRIVVIYYLDDAGPLGFHLNVFSSKLLTFIFLFLKKANPVSGDEVAGEGVWATD